jgi:multidrug transporter EmrE-like cation transporter
MLGMSFYVIFWLMLSILFEVLGDIGVKIASGNGGIIAWGLTMLCYNAMLVAWFMAIQRAKLITIPGTIWLTCGQLALIIVGCGLFKEHLSHWQMIGIVFALISLILLSL